jgi:hypothetical protein
MGVRVEERMDRRELTALRDILDLILELPDNVRAQIVAWLTPEASKPNGHGNGHDPHPPPIAAPEIGQATKGTPANPEPAAPEIRRPKPATHAGKVRRGPPASAAKAAELRLTEALCDGSGMSISALAKASGANRATTRERLNGLAARGAIEKDAEGLWRLKGDAAGPTSPSPAAS